MIVAAPDIYVQAGKVEGPGVLAAPGGMVGPLAQAGQCPGIGGACAVPHTPGPGER